MISRISIIILLVITIIYLTAWMNRKGYFSKISKFFFNNK
nr:MAG TPA: hypothetical protein [Caudoviricetes sp.]